MTQSALIFSLYHPQFSLLLLSFSVATIFVEHFAISSELSATMETKLFSNIEISSTIGKFCSLNFLFYMNVFYSIYQRYITRNAQQVFFLFVLSALATSFNHENFRTFQLWKGIARDNFLCCNIFKTVCIILILFPISKHQWHAGNENHSRNFRILKFCKLKKKI